MGYVMPPTCVGLLLGTLRVRKIKLRISEFILGFNALSVFGLTPYAETICHLDMRRGSDIILQLTPGFRLRVSPSGLLASP